MGDMDSQHSNTGIHSYYTPQYPSLYENTPNTIFDFRVCPGVLDREGLAQVVTVVFTDVVMMGAKVVMIVGVVLMEAVHEVTGVILMVAT
jgi:hypothetical protein